jgi:HK97 family phage major capsid protein
MEARRRTTRTAYEEGVHERSFVEHLQGKAFKDFSEYELTLLRPQSQRWVGITSMGVALPKRFANILLPEVAAFQGKALPEISAAGSGAGLVYAGVQPSLLKYPGESPSLFPRTMQIPADKGFVRWPQLKQAAPTDPGTVNELAEFGFSSADWIAEGAEAPGDETQFQQLAIECFNLVTYTELSVLLSNISAVAVMTLLSDVLRPALLYKLDLAIMLGDGVGKPKGVLNTADVQEVARASADDVSYEDLVEMEHKIPPQLRAASVWNIADDAVKALKLMKDDVGRPIIAANPAMGVDTLLGHPVIATQSRHLGDVGDVVFGYFGQYVCGVEDEVVLLSSTHHKFKENVNAFLLYLRVGGKPAQPRCFVKLVDPAV